MGIRAKRRSPLRDKPLRAAGQSVDDKLTNDVLPTLLAWWGMAAFTVVLTALEWFRSLRSDAMSPKTFTVIALVIIVLAAIKTRGKLATAKRLAMARDGERTVGELLQKLVAEGWRVFHDVPGQGFNIDHVAIGPAGILAIETKTYSKPTEGAAKIGIDDHGISLGGQPIGWGPVEQAGRQAAWLADLLHRSTGRGFRVRPVVLFPGWFIDDRRRRRDPWVLSARALPGWIARESRTLKDEDVALTALHLDRYIRTASAPAHG